MTTETPSAAAPGFVRTGDGTILVQLPADNRWGFSLHDDDQSWPGGFGAPGIYGNGSWELIDRDDPRITAEDHERLDWVLDEPE